MSTVIFSFRDFIIFVFKFQVHLQHELVLQEEPAQPTFLILQLVVVRLSLDKFACLSVYVSPELCGLSRHVSLTEFGLAAELVCGWLWWPILCTTFLPPPILHS